MAKNLLAANFCVEKQKKAERSWKSTTAAWSSQPVHGWWEQNQILQSAWPHLRPVSSVFLTVALPAIQSMAEARKLSIPDADSTFWKTQARATGKEIKW